MTARNGVLQLIIAQSIYSQQIVDNSGSEQLKCRNFGSTKMCMKGSNIEFPVIRRLARRDGVGREWLKKVGISERRGKLDPVLSKFEQVVSLFMPFQEWRNFGKFIDYGCHCFPEVEESLTEHDLHRGAPLDKVDRSCHNHQMCYACARNDVKLGGCDPLKAEYVVTAHWNTTGRERQPVFDCSRNIDDCSYSICQCDSFLAKQLFESQQDYDMSNHNEWGDLNREEDCQVVRHKKSAKTSKSIDSPIELKVVTEKPMPVTMTDSPAFDDDFEGEESGEIEVEDLRSVQEVILEPATPEELNVKLNAPPKTAKFTPTGVKVNVYQPFLKQQMVDSEKVPAISENDENDEIIDVVEDPEPNEEVYTITKNNPSPSIFPNSTTLAQLRASTTARPVVFTTKGLTEQPFPTTEYAPVWECCVSYRNYPNFHWFRTGGKKQCCRDTMTESGLENFFHYSEFKFCCNDGTVVNDSGLCGRNGVQFVVERR